MLALSEFWLLHGFKPAEALEHTLQAVPELVFLAPVFKKERLSWVIQESDGVAQSGVNDILQPYSIGSLRITAPGG